ncbi:AarF/UbiB family protein, partial [Sphingobacterium sp. T2]|uniref:AarF/UbiB family protein n=1 Tax=Sphingobacterium sp. T2 TaxID=1590596 RepID=UPI00057BB511
IDVLSSYYSIVREINLKHVFEAFAKSLLEELSFNNELKNIQIFERNFRGTPNILTMKGYPELSNDNVLCISFVEGTKINEQKNQSPTGLSIQKLFSTTALNYI